MKIGFSVNDVECKEKEEEKKSHDFEKFHPVEYAKCKHYQYARDLAIKLGEAKKQYYEEKNYSLSLCIEIAEKTKEIKKLKKKLKKLKSKKK